MCREYDQTKKAKRSFKVLELKSEQLMGYKMKTEKPNQNIHIYNQNKHYQNEIFLKIPFIAQNYQISWSNKIPKENHKKYFISNKITPKKTENVHVGRVSIAQTSALVIILMPNQSKAQQVCSCFSLKNWTRWIKMYMDVQKVENSQGTF